MTLEEERNVTLQRPDEKPPSGFGVTLIVEPHEQSAQALLDRLREAWSVVASWGRWSDEELGEWPEAGEALATLPEWLRTRVRAEPAYELQNWMDDLHDREWIWWSGAVVGDRVKLDVQALALPASLWPLESLVSWAGGAVLDRLQPWVPSDEVRLYGRTGGR
jgi:hypothetical protein